MTGSDELAAVGGCVFTDSGAGVAAGLLLFRSNIMIATSFNVGQTSYQQVCRLTSTDNDQSGYFHEKWRTTVYPLQVVALLNLIDYL
jgi:hypothetical protein